MEMKDHVCVVGDILKKVKSMNSDLFGHLNLHKYIV